MNWYQNIINLLLQRRNVFFTGLLQDDRTQGEKDKDYKHSERVFPASSDPFSNPRLTQSPYPYFNQLSTSSCVPHAVGLALEIERKRDIGDLEQLSPMFIYRQRGNYPQEGSYPPEIFNLYKSKGSCLYTTLPTPQVESQANAIVLTQQEFTEANIFKGPNFFTVDVGFNNINTLANIAAQGHGVTITLFATEEEYSRQRPIIINPNLKSYQGEVQHEVCILPNSGFTENGVKYVVVQDSAWFGGWRLRELSEAFILSRITTAGYWDTAQPLSTGPRPKYLFTKSLSVGSTGPDVKALQLLLISEGLLPSDLATGNFGGYTLAGVKAFQTRYASEVLTPVGLNIPTGYFGPGSIRKANQLTA